jgi:hypothetical protein
MSRLTVTLAALLAVGAALVGSWQGLPALPPDGWRTFTGSWTAAGSRHSIPTELGRPAGVIRLSGAVAIAAGGELGRGFRGEVVAYDDGGSLVVGRAVWVDARGDRIFSELRAEPIATGRRITGTITGGTGRYAGLTGEYAFRWQYVVETAEGEVQGHTTGLTGRFHPGRAQP